MKQIQKNLSVLLSLFAIAVSQQSFAHGRYVLPSHTVLSGDGAAQVSLTASISNDVFNADRPLGNNTLEPKGAKSQDFGGLKKMFEMLNYQLIDPEGKLHTITWQAYRRFSVADISLPVSGTYRVTTHQPTTYMTLFKYADGSPGRIFGKQAKLPEGASNSVRRTYESRTESFISYNQPNDNAIKPLGKGLELSSDSSHPNDLFVGEVVNFQLYLNGKPLAEKAEITLTKEGTRYRNQRDSKIIHTAAHSGKFQLEFDQPGLYLLEANADIPGLESSVVDIHGYSLYVTLEVFPE